MKSVENIDSASFREKRTRVFARVLDRYSDDPGLNTPEGRLNYFRSLGSEGFISSITAINRLVTKNHNLDQANNFFTERTNATASPNDPDIYQGMSVPEDKAALMKYLYDYCYGLSNDHNENIDRIATVLGCGINAIHAFADGNGRTARASYDLLTRNPSEWYNSLERSSVDEKNIANRLNPASLRDVVYTNLKYHLQTHDFNQEEPSPRVPIALLDSSKGPWVHLPNNRKENLNDTELLIGIMNDKHLINMVPTRLVDTYNSDATEKAILNYKGQNVFCMDVFAKEADQTDMRYLRHVYREIVNMYFTSLIDLIGGTVESPVLYVNTAENGIITTDAPSLMTNLANGNLTLAEN